MIKTVKMVSKRYEEKLNFEEMELEKGTVDEFITQLDIESLKKQKRNLFEGKIIRVSIYITKFIRNMMKIVYNVRDIIRY